MFFVLRCFLPHFVWFIFKLSYVLLNVPYDCRLRLLWREACWHSFKKTAVRATIADDKFYHVYAYVFTTVRETSWGKIVFEVQVRDERVEDIIILNRIHSTFAIHASLSFTSVFSSFDNKEIAVNLSPHVCGELMHVLLFQIFPQSCHHLENDHQHATKR